MSTTVTRSSPTRSSLTTSSLEAAARRLALLLTSPGGPVADQADLPGGLEYEPVVELRPLARTAPPADVWAVDGGQAVVADARCLQLLVTRAAPGALPRRPLRPRGRRRAPRPRCWEAASRGRPLRGSAWRCRPTPRSTSTSCATGGVGGGRALRRSRPSRAALRPRRRRPPARLADPVDLGRRAAGTGPRAAACSLAAVTKHSSLARRRRPAARPARASRRRRGSGRGRIWWAPVAPHTPTSCRVRRRPAGRRRPARPRRPLRVPHRPPGRRRPRGRARRARRTGRRRRLPRLPYPLTVADRLAACPGWLRHEVRAPARRPLRPRGRAPRRARAGLRRPPPT